MRKRRIISRLYGFAAQLKGLWLMNRRQRAALWLGLSAIFLAALSTMGVPTFATALTMTISPTLSPTSTLSPDNITYTVRAGDTLFRIAQQFGVTVNAIAQVNQLANPNNLRIGQTLIIPVRPTEQPTVPKATITMTPEPTFTATQTLEMVPETSPTPQGEQIVETVLSGDTLSRFAQRHGTTVQELIRLNNIQNPDLIIAGSRLIVRDGTLPSVRATPLPDQPNTPANEVIGIGYGRGISVNLQGQNPATLVEQIISLNIDWVKLDVDWRSVEVEDGVYDFGSLDTVVFNLSDAGIDLLLTLDNSPAWARTAQLEDGPPDDFAVFARFAGNLAGRYAGRVAAYQIWNEPNLRREWFSDVHKIDPSSYFDLFSQAAGAIKIADPTAMVITAGLAPTGFNDGVNALNHSLYLQNLYDLGLAEVADGIAVHALGFANPPESQCCQAIDGVLTHFENRSFYFRDTIEDYHQIAEANGDKRPLWITKFGWGSSEGKNEPSADFVYLTYTTALEQAQYVPAGFEVGQSLGYVGPMFLYNLNGCSIPDGRAELCYFSLTSADGTPSAAFNALRAMPR